MITGFTGKVFATSPLVAEAMALREAISLAANLSIENVLLESDSLDLINACRGETEIGEIRNIVQDVKHMRMSFRKCGFTWIHRSGNNLGHTLAQKVQRNLIPPSWTQILPQDIQQILQEERPRRIQETNTLNHQEEGRSTIVLNEERTSDVDPHHLVDVRPSHASKGVTPAFFPPDPG